MGAVGEIAGSGIVKLKQSIRSILPDDIVMWMKAGFDYGNNRKMLRKKERIRPYQAGRYPMGINLIGDVRAETGLGQSMRLLAEILEESNVPFIIKQVDSPGGLRRNENQWESRISDELKYAVNLIHINPGIWAESYNRFPAEVLDYRYHIAYWLWELETFPERWRPCIETVDEIWAPSEFISQSIRKITSKNVETVPYCIHLKKKEPYGRAYFGLPENKFLFLTMYDFKSVSERKNPKAAIAAYMKAFRKEETGVGLVVKIGHLQRQQELEQLRRQLTGYPNIYFITENLSRQEVESLILGADALISLHRSEGFGLPIAEAMCLGRPVVATAWSANMEFMDEICSCPVDYKLVEIRKTVGPYPKGSRWAEPDTEHAAEYLRKLYEEQEYCRTISKNAKVKIGKVLNGGRAAKMIRERFSAYGEIEK